MPKRYNVKPTPMQAKALELIRDGKTPTQAMREAGYAETSVQAPTKNLLARPGAQDYILQYKEAYAAAGITPTFMAAKSKEWLSAQKIDHSHTEPDQLVPDYQTQLKAAELVRKDWGLGQDSANTFIAGGDLSLEFSVKHDESRNT